MARIISIPGEPRMVKLDKKSTPLMLTLTAGHIRRVFISPPGELTNMEWFIVAIGSIFVAKNIDGMNECDALESKKTIAGFEFARNIPNTTSSAC
jgi:hypothetical protein